jgi:hypothetical protein
MSEIIFGMVGFVPVVFSVIRGAGKDHVTLLSLRRFCKPKSLYTFFQTVENQRPILIFAPRGQTLTPGAKLSPRGKFCPVGVKLSPWGEILCLPLHSSM